MKELTREEIHSVSGGFLVQIGMGMAGMTIGLGTYSMVGGIRGNITPSGLIGAAVGGAVTGLGGFSPAAGIAGGIISAGVQEAIEDRTDS